MGKLLSWVVLIALAWLVIHLIAISQRRRERSRGEGDAADATKRAGPGRTAGRTIEGEPIVPCAHCGVFVPASDAVRDDGLAYCGVAHRDAARAARRDGEGPAARRPPSRDE